jgi:sacsin
MAGAGKLRSDWNRCLLAEVVGPLYAQLLGRARELLGHSAAFFALWPSRPVPEPWSAAVERLYQELDDLPVVHSAVCGGRWLTPSEACFADDLCGR